ncbi:hypothetical protein CEXT_745671 [Caerostris extrusa]|uniref:Uncharacterized protein n=1 Tax=Caerostris extrusa TaxID=172846 RepID=A0AAV4NUB0_CAEEX|nr:hypothetical protein CEXT_745671 [Caerostris extrusa]
MVKEKKQKQPVYGYFQSAAIFELGKHNPWNISKIPFREKPLCSVLNRKYPGVAIVEEYIRAPRPVVNPRRAQLNIGFFITPEFEFE